MTVAVGFVGISLLQHASLNVDVLLSVSGVVGISLLQHASLNMTELSVSCLLSSLVHALSTCFLSNRLFMHISHDVASEAF